MYTVASIHTNPVEAHIYLGRLKAEGIEGLVLFEHHIWVKWSISHALGCVRLLVPIDMAESAAQVIRSIQSGEYETQLIEQQGISKLACPKCGSTNNGAHEWLWKLALVCLFTISLTLPYTSHLYSCDDCKHSWIAHEQRPYPLMCILFYILLATCCFTCIYFVLIYLQAPNYFLDHISQSFSLDL